MRPLLALSNSIDWINEKLGGVCNWLVPDTESEE